MTNAPNTSQATLGVLAGSGNLPPEIIRACEAQQRPCFVVGFEGITPPAALEHVPHHVANIGQVGHIIACLRAHHVSQIVLAGRVGRPDPATLKLDFGAWRLAHRFAQLPSHGDDQIFSAIIAFLEARGFEVIGAHDILSPLLMPKGPLGRITPNKTAERDIQLGIQATKALGALDIGQAAIVQQGQILGLEAAEGTDALLARCGPLQARGLGGVLVKTLKPGQDKRVDLPSIGVHTIGMLARGGYQGVALSAGGALVIDREAVQKAAEEAGLFVVGVPTD